MVNNFLLLGGRHIRFFEDEKAMVYQYNGKVRELDLLNKKISKEIFTAEDTDCAYHSLWAKLNTNFVFKSSRQKVSITDLNYQNINLTNSASLDVGSRIRHIIGEDENNILVLCESHVYRFNSIENSFKPIELPIDSWEISSGIVVNGFLLLDMQHSNSNHQLSLFNLKTNQCITTQSIDLKTTM